MSTTGTITYEATATYSVADIKRVLDNFAAEFTMISQATGRRTREYVESMVSDLKVFAEREYIAHKVAVNTLIQKIDDLKKYDGRVLVFLCTNRFSALDPAIIRRAGRVEIFSRPDEHERELLLKMDCDGLGFSDEVPTTKL